MVVTSLQTPGTEAAAAARRPEMRGDGGGGDQTTPGSAQRSTSAGGSCSRRRSRGRAGAGGRRPAPSCPARRVCGSRRRRLFAPVRRQPSAPVGVGHRSGSDVRSAPRPSLRQRLADEPHPLPVVPAACGLPADFCSLGSGLRAPGSCMASSPSAMAAARGRKAAGRCSMPSLLLLLVVGPALGWSDPDRILLRDVKAFTLHHDRYTTSRRLHPVPQLKCVGGTAGCDSYTPSVVQCQNKGWDGYDVQWECKTDLDIAYKFGKTVVSCEGYESSEDPYVLRGSCGLEYNLDYTEIGLKKLRESGKHHGFSSFSNYYNKLHSPDSSGMSGLVIIVVLLAVAFGVYKLFLSDGQDSPPPYSEYPPYAHGYQRFSSSAGSPPPGFKSEFTGPHGATSGFGSAFTGQQGYENSGPGFWTGLGTGGLLGYLFGSNRAATPFSDCPPSYSSTWTSRAYSPLHGGSGSSSAYSGPETRTRTASAYGGTRRR